MANIMFKRGLESALPTVGTDGTFYLTTDTHRLYVAQGEKVVPLNDGINILPKWSDIQALGQKGAVKYGEFYYAKAENILCVNDGTGWTQINPDTDTTIDAIDFTVSLDADKKIATLKTMVSSVKGTADAGDLTADIKVKAGNNISLDATGDELTINAVIPQASTYSISHAANGDAGAKVVLSTSDNAVTATEVAFVGAGATTVSNETGNIKIESVDRNLGNAKVNATSGFVLTLDQLKNEVLESAEAVKFTLAPKIEIDGSQIEFTNSIADLDTILEPYINKLTESKLQAVNAMEFKGSAAGTYPSGNIKNGYTYIVTEALENPSAAIGDLIIATGNEDSTGYIPAANLSWTVVASGDEIDTTYTATAAGGDKSLTIVNDINKGNLAKIIVKDVDSNPVSVAMTPNGSTATWEISHDTKTATTSNSAVAGAVGDDSMSFSAVKSVTADAYGHISTIETETVTLAGYEPKISSTSGMTVATATNGAAVKLDVDMVRGNSSVSSSLDSTVNFVADTASSVAVSVVDSNVQIGLVWGTF